MYSFDVLSIFYLSENARIITEASLRLPKAECKVFGVVLQVNIKQDVLMHFELFGQGVDEEPKGVLSINGDTGMVYVHKALDYEERKMLKVRLDTYD